MDDVKLSNCEDVLNNFCLFRLSRKGSSNRDVNLSTSMLWRVRLFSVCYVCSVPVNMCSVINQSNHKITVFYRLIFLLVLLTKHGEMHKGEIKYMYNLLFAFIWNNLELAIRVDIMASKPFFLLNNAQTIRDNFLITVI